MSTSNKGSCVLGDCMVRPEAPGWLPTTVCVCVRVCLCVCWGRCQEAFSEKLSFTLFCCYLFCKRLNTITSIIIFPFSSPREHDMNEGQLFKRTIINLILKCLHAHTHTHTHVCTATLFTVEGQISFMLQAVPRGRTTSTNSTKGPGLFACADNEAGVHTELQSLGDKERGRRYGGKRP